MEMDQEAKKSVLGHLKKVTYIDEEGICNILCACGRFVPILEEEIPELLEKNGLSKDTDITSVMFEDCHNCKNGHKHQIRIVENSG